MAEAGNPNTRAIWFKDFATSFRRQFTSVRKDFLTWAVSGLKTYIITPILTSATKASGKNPVAASILGMIGGALNQLIPSGEELERIIANPPVRVSVPEQEGGDSWDGPQPQRRT